MINYRIIYSMAKLLDFETYKPITQIKLDAVNETQPNLLT